MRSLRSILVVGVAGALVLTGGVVAAVVGPGESPSDVARAYLAALQAGHVSKAASLSTNTADGDRSLLTADLPAVDRVSDTKLGKVVEKGNSATAETSYDLGSIHATETLRLSKQGGHWRIDNGLSPLLLSGAPDDVRTATVNGKQVRLRDGETSLLVVPGLYSASIPASFAFTADTEDAAVTGDQGAVEFTLLGTDAGDAAAKAAVLKALKACLAKAHVIENPCGTVTTKFTDKADFTFSGVHWQLVKAPELFVDSSGKTYTVGSVSTGTALLSVFAVDRKHRFPPGRIPVRTEIRTLIAEVTFSGRTPTVTFPLA